MQQRELFTRLLGFGSLNCLTIDPGGHNTGYSLIKCSKNGNKLKRDVIKYGHFESDSEDLICRCNSICSQLMEVYRKISIHVLILEEPAKTAYNSGGKGKAYVINRMFSVAHLHAVNYFIASAIIATKTRTLLSFVQPSQWQIRSGIKKYGGSKEWSLAMASSIVGHSVLDHNAADAICIGFLSTLKLANGEIGVNLFN